jgi:S1-C subfamily serine protease
VLAIGNPFSLQRTLTLGIVSALQRVIQSPDGSFIGQAIQTDAAINPGNSGGPLLDLEGHVVGVNSQIVGITGGNVGVGFAIASNTLRQVVPQLIATGRYPHPWLGMDMLDITPQAAQILRQVGVDIAVDLGVLVITVAPGSPAEAADIHGADRNVRIGRSPVGVGGDIITAVDDQPVTAQQDLMLYVDTQKAIGDTITLKLMRGGKEMTTSLTLGEQPQSQ